MKILFLSLCFVCSLSGFELRPAEPKDLNEIYNLVCELAAFEGKDLSTLPVTKENLSHFGDYFQTEIAEVDGKIVGYALYSYPFSGHQGRPFLYIDDLYVTPDYRGQGIGTGLLKKLARNAEEIACCRMEWHVFDWNSEALGFYEKIGGKLRKDLLAVRLEKEAMLQLGNQ